MGPEGESREVDEMSIETPVSEAPQEKMTEADLLRSEKFNDMMYDVYSYYVQLYGGRLTPMESAKMREAAINIMMRQPGGPKIEEVNKHLFDTISEYMVNFYGESLGDIAQFSSPDGKKVDYAKADEHCKILREKYLETLNFENTDTRPDPDYVKDFLANGRKKPEEKSYVVE